MTESPDGSIPYSEKFSTRALTPKHGYFETAKSMLTRSAGLFATDFRYVRKRCHQPKDFEPDSGRLCRVSRRLR